MDDYEDEKYINLALIANTDKEASSSNYHVLTTNISDLTKEECNLTIDRMYNDFCNLHVPLKSFIKQNARIKKTRDFLKERNFLLEFELFNFEKIKREF